MSEFLDNMSPISTTCAEITASSCTMVTLAVAAHAAHSCLSQLVPRIGQNLGSCRFLPDLS